MVCNPSRATRIKRVIAATAISLPLIALPISLPSAEGVQSGAPFAVQTAWADGTSSENGQASRLLPANALTELAETVQKAGDITKQKAAKAAQKLNCILPYDAGLIAQIGSQQTSGHWICCPEFACAYGDAIIHGVANSHASYGCGCCTWPGWGGGSSSFRSLGTNQALLKEAYDSIAAGKPTVVHVAGSSGEHWICLIGYRDAVDPNNLTLENFIALDPVDGEQITASDRYGLYGDACEHVSDAL